MSGFTTYNAAGSGGAGGATGNVGFSYDPYYTASVPTQNIPSGQASAGVGQGAGLPGAYYFDGSTYLRVTNPSAPNSTYNAPVTGRYSQLIGSLGGPSGTGNFTVEMWINPTNVNLSVQQGLMHCTNTNNSSECGLLINQGGSGTNGKVSWYSNTTGAISSPLNTLKANGTAAGYWQHIAYVRNSGTGTLYVDGVAVTSSADATTYDNTKTIMLLGSWNAGNDKYTGYISQPRITLSAVYTSDFVPNAILGVGNSILYLPAAGGTSGGATSDYSPSGQTVSAVAGSLSYGIYSPVTAPSSGMFLSDTTSNIKTSTSSAFNFGTGNFMVEYWLNQSYTTTTNQRFVGFSGAGNVVHDSSNQPSSVGWGIFNATAGSTITAASGFFFAPNSWNHIAWGKSGSNVTIWVNGQQVSSSAYNGTIGGGTSFLMNGIGDPGGNVNFGPVRVSNSAVYTTGTNFSPPTTFAKTANTVFLLQGGANLSSYLTDQSVNQITVNSFGNILSTRNNTNFNVSANVIGDISGATNTGLILRTSGTGNATGATFLNNYGGYWQFNGSTSNSTIQTTKYIANNKISTSTSTWIQTSTGNTVIAVMENGLLPVTSSTNVYNLAIAPTGNLTFYAYPGTGVTTTAVGNVLDNKWHHVVNTYNPSTGAVVMYLDGQVVASPTITVGGTVYNGYYKIGTTSFPSLGNSFSGNIGPTVIYNSVLTPAQVSQIYTTQSPRFGVNAGVPAGSYTLSSTGTVQSFTIPAGVTQISVRAVGGGGAGGNLYGTGGAGSNVLANIAVVPGSTYYAVVGRGGTRGNTTTMSVALGGGGGAGNVNTGSANSGGQGGGFTGIFTIDPTTVPAAQAQQYAVLIAGGGGGGEGWIGFSGLSGNAGNASISLTGIAQGGISAATVGNWYFTNGWSSTGTQVVANITQINGTNIPQGSANLFSVGEAIQITGVGNVLAGQYLTVASITGNTMFLNNGNIVSFPTTGTTGGNTQFAPFDYVHPWNQSFQGGGPATTTAVGYPGLQNDGIGGDTTVMILPTAGNSLQGGQGGYYPSAVTFGGGGGGGGGYYGGGGGASGGAYAMAGGGGSNYANTQFLVGNTVTYGTMTAAAAAANGANGSMTVSWSVATSANYGYSGDIQSFTVPAGVTQISARLYGAAGGGDGGTNHIAGGSGANILANITVTPGQTLYMIVGKGGGGSGSNIATIAGTLAQGAGGAGGTYNAANAYSGGGGGGFTGIFNQFPSNAAVAASSAILIAGGGGGGYQGGSYTGVAGNAGANINSIGNAASSAAASFAMNRGWSSTGTQIVGNISQIWGNNVTEFTAANVFTTGARVQMSVVGSTAIGNVVAGEYLTVASSVGNLVYFSNGNVASFPASGATAGNTYVSNYDGLRNITATNYGVMGGMGGTLTTGGASGLPIDGVGAAFQTTYSLPTPGSQFFGGTGSNALALSGSFGGGGGGGGGYYGGGGGVAFNNSAAGGGGGSSYANPLYTNGATAGTLVTNIGNTGYNGNISLSWTNSANFGYVDGQVQSFTVPPYVTRVTARVVGAAGGVAWSKTASNVGSYGGNGGAGANISCTMTVTPGQTLYLVAGQGGLSNSLTGTAIAAGNISQGGGGGVGATSGVGGVSGGGGGFSGIFTVDPSTVSVSAAAAAAVVVAGGGAGGAAFSQSSIFCQGGNAASTINSQGGSGINASGASASFFQAFTNAVSNGSTITVNLSQSQITGNTALLYTVGQYLSLGGASNYSNSVPLLVTAVSTNTLTLGNAAIAVKAAATYTGGNIINGGYNGSAVANFNFSGGGGYPWAGGYGSTPIEWFNTTTYPGTTYPTGGTQLQGGNGAGPFNNSTALPSHSPGAGGGGGWFGGGGGSAGGGGVSSGGGGSSYANAQVVTNLAYGTQTINSTGGSQTHGYITLSW